MNGMINNIGGFVFLLFDLSMAVGALLVILYVIFNAYVNSRSFYKAPSFIKNISLWLVDFTYIWGPKLLIFYFLGRFVVSILNFIF